MLIRIRRQIDDDVASRTGLAALYLWLVQYGREIGWFSCITQLTVCRNVSVLIHTAYGSTVREWRVFSKRRP